MIEVTCKDTMMSASRARCKVWMAAKKSSRDVLAQGVVSCQVAAKVPLEHTLVVSSGNQLICPFTKTYMLAYYKRRDVQGSWACGLAMPKVILPRDVQQLGQAPLVWLTGFSNSILVLGSCEIKAGDSAKVLTSGRHNAGSTVISVYIRVH